MEIIEEQGFFSQRNIGGYRDDHLLCELERANLKSKVQGLEARIIHFRQLLKNVRMTEAGVQFAGRDLLDAYDMHFGITTHRNGTTGNGQ